jgi:predicted nucleic acid-binding protein
MMNEINQLMPGGAAVLRARPKVYLDSSIWAALFGREADKRKMAHDILEDGREGRIEVVVSTLTMIECEAGTTQEGQDLLSAYFESDFIVRCNVDPFVALTARGLREKLGGVSPLTPQLWLHAATALWENCGYLMTYEKRLLKLAGERDMASTRIMLPCRPWDAGQMSLADLDGVMPESPAIIDRRSLVI